MVVDLPLLRGNLNFIWNHGWYHAYEEYNTDDECSFTIFDYEGNELYTSAELEDGVFMTYENNCEETPLACYPVENLEGEYLWNSSEEYGAYLTWDSPEITTYLDHFNVFRQELVVKELELIAEIPFTGAINYDFFDNMVDFGGELEYAVTCVFIKNDEQCESELVGTPSIIITDVTENSNSSIQVYPNPTNGLLKVSGNGMMHITVSNVLGQTICETTAEGNATLDLSRYVSGMYLLRIETDNITSMRKIYIEK